MSTTGPVQWNRGLDETRISISCNSDRWIGIRASREEGVSAKASVAIDRLPEFIAALYAAAGKPEPVILERPRPRDLLVPGAGDGESWVDVTPSRIRDGGVTLAPRVWSNDNGGYGSVRLVGDEPLRVAVALVDAMRDMQDEPDPAEVEELAALMDAEMERRGAGQSGLYPAVARIALQWMNGRQQRGGEA